MPYTQKILQLLEKRDYVPLSAREIAQRLKIKGGQHTTLKRELKQMQQAGKIALVKEDLYCLPRDADLVTGRITFRQSGAALLIPDPKADESAAPRLRIRAEDTGVALHGDHVLARLVSPKKRSFRTLKGKRRDPMADKEPDRARVIRILERARETLTGTLQRSHLYHFVIPDDPRIIQDILVPNPRESSLQPTPRVNDKVIVSLDEWKQRHLNPEGEIIAVLGENQTPSAEWRALLHRYNLDPEFPEAVLREVGRLPQTVSPKDHRDRLDMRSHFTLTIDPDDAKDFDDALSLERLDSGNVRVGVHIADVSAYVKPETALDKEARRRGNSTYLVGQVIPMLPHALSNGICSLVEAEDRLTKSVFFTYSEDGRLRRTQFANTVIRSRKRLTYKQAYALLREKDLKKIRQLPVPPAHQTGFSGRPLDALSNAELKRLQEGVRLLWSIAERLRTRRLHRGSLDLDMPEVKITVDEAGAVDRIERVGSDESHQLIEEFMLAANEAVARSLFQARIPLISRVHDKPEAEKLNELREYLVDFNISAGELTVRKHVTELLRKLKNHPQGHTLRIEFLRRLKQACYRTQGDGHYGLNKTHYTHFTSPIRRYCDLLLHRLFDGVLVNRGKATSRGLKKSLRSSQLADIARHLSRTEQNSVEAERDCIKLKLLEFFARELKKRKKTVFEAVIMEPKNHGLFVELTESMAYGLVHISTLRDDLYTLKADGTALVGRRKKKTYTVGETVRVVVARVDRFKRQIDFSLV